MPRIAREDILYDGCYAHIISRSIRKMKLFKDGNDFQELYRFFEQTKRQVGYKIYHYCFMHTHFHLVVNIPDVKKFSKAIGFIKSQYCQNYHTRYRISGPIWRERYRALLIENEDYLRACGQYIENNPVNAGLVAKDNNWHFSSSRHYSGDTHDSLIDGYGGNNNIMQVSQVDFEESEFFEQGNVIGSAFFRWQIYEKLKRS